MAKATKAQAPKETMADDPVQTVLEIVKQMNILQISQLIKAMEEEFGVTAAAPMVAAPMAVAPTEQAAVAEEKTEFEVVLKEFGAEKIKVIKVVRELTGLGLREAKELVEGAPRPVRQGISQDEANTAKAKLEEVGASVEIK